MADRPAGRRTSPPSRSRPVAAPLRVADQRAQALPIDVRVRVDQPIERRVALLEEAVAPPVDRPVRGVRAPGDGRTGKSLADSSVRLFPKDADQKISVPYSEIAALVFTGRDTAAGKSFEAWVRKYWEKKAAGEKNIGIQAEALE